MSLQLSFAEASAIGLREENQDALRLVTPAPALAASKGYLFAIADGVSQCADGGLAARSTLQALAQDYYATPETWAVAQALDRLLLAQNRWLQANGGGQPLLTTVSALVVRGRRFTLAHVGDCRVYRWHAGKLQRISEDHVWDQPGMQHVLKRAMGLDQHLVLDFLDGELRLDESFVLLSDGVWAVLGDTAIAAILRDQPDLQSAAQTLVSAAHLAGSRTMPAHYWCGWMPWENRASAMPWCTCSNGRCRRRSSRGRCLRAGKSTQYSRRASNRCSTGCMTGSNSPGC